MTMQQIAPLLWLMFGSALLIYTIYGFILGYHWIRYSANYAITLLTLAAYIGAGLFLFALMFGALLTL